MHRLLLALTVAVLAVAAGLPAAADAGGTRLYLTSNDGQYQYWTTDPADRDLGVATARYRCPGPPGERVCSAGAGSRFYTVFEPAALIDGPVTWSAADPVRFHFELTVDTPEPYTVHAAFLDGLQFATSPAATEVSPGVWEGAITERGRWDPNKRGSLIYIFVRGPQQQVPINIDLKLAGHSWLELPDPVPARAVPELLRTSPDAAAPATYATPARTFWFNDDQWEVTTFDGSLSSPASFDITLPRTAETILAWVEAYDAPFTHHAARQGQVDAARLTDTPILRLKRNGAEIGAGYAQYNQRGRGNNALATTRVPAGTVTLEVSQYDGTPSQGQTYRAYVLALYGTRTLQRMRWSYEPAIAEPFIPARASAGTCVNPTEPVPTTAAVTTFDVDIDWDTAGLPTAGYTVGYEPSYCGERGIGDTVRFTVPGERVWLFTATPSRAATFVGYRDTVFTMDVRYSYAPAV